MFAGLWWYSFVSCLFKKRNVCGKHILKSVSSLLRYHDWKLRPPVSANLTWHIPGNSCPRIWGCKTMNIFTICFSKFLYTNRSGQGVCPFGQMVALQDIRFHTWVNNLLVKQVYLSWLNSKSLHVCVHHNMSQTSLKTKQFWSLKELA